MKCFKKRLNNDHGDHLLWFTCSYGHCLGVYLYYQEVLDYENYYLHASYELSCIQALYGLATMIRATGQHYFKCSMSKQQAVQF